MPDISAHIPRLRRYARALTGDRFLADDLVQDTLKRAFVKVSLWRLTGRFESWLLSIMHNVFVNQIKAKACRPHETVLDDSGARCTERRPGSARSGRRLEPPAARAA
jgi:RNA polymerase sigma-70 factor (ECF subfamily)